ncbi:MAG: hypothetical protein R3F41_00955 [Gammaproteobacteria bacterium]|nr:hypothetical protein [Pseudomonadales bacterium]
MSGAFRKPLRQTLSDIVLLILALAILLANAAQAAPDYFANNYPSLRELLKDAAGADAVGLSSIKGSKFIYPALYLIGETDELLNSTQITRSFFAIVRFDNGLPYVEDFVYIRPGEISSFATKMSGDPYVTGYADAGGSSPYHAYVFESETESFQDLGAFSDIGFSYGTAVNVDGSVVAGSASLAVDGEGAGLDILHGFRWTESSGMVDLGSLAGPTGTSRAFDINGDGAVIVGESKIPSGEIHAFRWTEQSGLEDLGAVGTGRSVATAVTYSGDVIVGGSGNAVRWTEATGMIDLGAPDGATNSIATGVSNSGAIVVGNYDNVRLDINTDGIAEFSGTTRPFRWTDDGLGGHGMMDLQELLQLQGVDFTGFTLISADGVSEDGQFIFGSMLSNDAENFEPLPYVVQLCDDFVDLCFDGTANSWPSLFSGVIPDPSWGLALNNIGTLYAMDGLIYSCLKVMSNGLPSSLNGIPSYDIGFEIVSYEQGTIGVAKARPFNETLALNGNGEPPDCSGSIDLITNIYADLIQVGSEVFDVRFELFDGENLRLRLLTLEPLTPSP